MDLINRNNYEIFFVDYLDGKLDEESALALRSFLEANPDLKEELDLIDLVELEKITEHYDQKKQLYKDVSTMLPKGFNTLDELLIAEMEGDLELQNYKSLQKILNIIPDAANDRTLFQKTRLIPDKEIVFIEKNFLKKEVLSDRPLWRKRFLPALAVAASFAIVFFLILNRSWINFGQDSTGELNNRLSTASLLNYPLDNNVIMNTEDRAGYLKRQYQEIENNTETPSEMSSAIDYMEQERMGRINNKNFTSDLMTASFASTTGLLNSSSLSPEEAIPVNQVQTLSPAQYIMGFLKKEVLKIDKTENENKITAWALAESGIRKINEVSNSNMQLQKTFNPDGTVRSINFSSRLIAFSAPVRSKK